MTTLEAEGGIAVVHETARTLEALGVVAALARAVIRAVRELPVVRVAMALGTASRGVLERQRAHRGGIRETRVRGRRPLEFTMAGLAWSGAMRTLERE